MKQYNFLILLFICFMGLLSAQQTNSEYFYYYKDGKINLDIDYNYFTVVTEGEFDATTKKSKLSFKVENSEKRHVRYNINQNDKNKIKNENKAIYYSDLNITSNVTNEEYDNLIYSIKQEKNVMHILPSFLIKGERISISNNFYVKLFDENDLIYLYDLADKYFIEVINNNEFMPLWYTLECDDKSLLNSLEAANFFYETKLFEYSEPELIYHNLFNSHDPYFNKQWALKNTGQNGGTVGIDIKAEQAWEITKGANIKVAVYDSGFEMDHPDLKNNVFGNGYNVMHSKSPQEIWGKHGTAVAGIIGAVQNNNIGVSGVAPECKLISVSFFVSASSDKIADGFNWAWRNGADIISNSWSSNAYSEIVNEAISNALLYGRNGKGTVIVFASSNENTQNIKYPAKSHPLILVVGAASPCGERKNPSSCDGEDWGSNYGTELDIMAPGVLIPTTDEQGSNGYNISNGTAGDYHMTFNGTSSACPHVAGVAALILSVNPNLTVLQVNNIIESTAQKVGNYNYQNVSGRTNGTWNKEMGYGLIDAYAAVMKAHPCAPTNILNRIFSSNTTISGCDVLIKDVTVQNNAKLTINYEQNVTIQPGFEIKYGSVFEAR